MILEEYDEAKHIENEKAISYEDGLKAGIEQGIEQSRTAMILKALDNGAAPKDLKIFGIEEDEVRRVMEKAGR